MSTAISNDNIKELEKSVENSYRIHAARADELEFIGRQMVDTVRRINSYIDRLRVIREEIRTEIRNGL